jgi:septum formation protein
MSLILASASPRRRDLLREAGYGFDVDPAHVDESEAAGEAPRAYVLRVAALKARAVAARHPAHTVLAADTTVVVDAVMLAKPVDDDDARRMLRLLSGRAHVVLTGVVVRAAGGEWSEVAESRVRFRPLTPDEIDWYVATGEPHDKAGAYAVQGLAARFVDAVDGSYSNVVGLPMGAVGGLLAAAGVLPEDAARAAAWREPSPFDRTGG